MGLVEKKDGLWFFEDLYTDITYGFKISKVLVPEMETGFQKLMILETERLGRILILDGVVQLTEEDESIYHEWIVHWPLFAMAKPPEKVLIIGGGDGGVACHVLMHPSIKEVIMVEIDQQVIDLCRKYIPDVSGTIWNDPRFTLMVKDGAEMIRSRKDYFDAIIIDSTDPIGPARSLFNTNFYQDVYQALSDGGIAIHQTGSLILQPFECPASWRQMERTFDDVQVVQFATASYMGGPFSLTAGSKGKKVFSNAAARIKKNFETSKIKTRWFSPHVSATLYPEFQHRLEQDKYGEEVVMELAMPSPQIPDVEKVAQWSMETCTAIKMIAFGQPMLSHPILNEGETLVQYIETSAINYRQYKSSGSANCFTCAHLPVAQAVAYSIKFYQASHAICWHIPRGSFNDIHRVQQHSHIFQAEPDIDPNYVIPGTTKIYRPRLVESAEIFSSQFQLPMEKGFSSACELILDIYDCDYSIISSCEAVTQWASEEFCRATGLDPVGKSDAPDFGHAKKKTAGPSVTQFLKGGSNISHYSINWLLLVVNLVSQKPYNLKSAIASALSFFKAERAVGWLIPRGIDSAISTKKAADETLIFQVMKRDIM